MRLFVLRFILTAIAVGAQNKKQIIWNNVQTGYSVVPREYLNVTKVTMADDRTEVSLSFSFKGQKPQIGFSQNTSLLVNGDNKKAYKVKSATVIELGKPYNVTSDTLDLVFTFEPVPADAKMLTFFDKDFGFVIHNIHL